MTSKPGHFCGPTERCSWDPKAPFQCPLCGGQVRYKYNDGGRTLHTLAGAVWLVRNFYSCASGECPLHAPFPAGPVKALPRKKFGLGVWAQVILYHLEDDFNYLQIKAKMWKKHRVKVAKNTVRAICEFFNIAGSAKQAEEALQAVVANGHIVLSLDAARPIDGEPALWIFSDRLTGKVLLARVFEHATADALGAALEEILERFKVPIAAVISDRQEAIVLAVARHLPGVPHAYCHLHFLKNVARPVAKKDTRLLGGLQRAVRSIRVVIDACQPAEGHRVSAGDPVRVILSPLVEELKCAVSARGDSIKVFPGLEAFASVEYLRGRVEQYLAQGLPYRVERSLRAIAGSLDRALGKFAPLQEVVAALAKDFERLRRALASREWEGRRVRQEVKKWVKMLQSRLRRRELEHAPARLKRNRCPVGAAPAEVWQEWVRLVAVHEAGLFVAYDHPAVEFTNNGKEYLICTCKRHFRRLHGRVNVGRAFHAHGATYCRVLELEKTEEAVTSVLASAEVAAVEDGVRQMRAQNARVRREWRIREKSTGNLEKFEEFLRCIT